MKNEISAMRIAVVHSNLELARRWRDALSAELREAHVEIWGDSYRGDADYVVGRPPPEFFTQQPRLRAVFSIGAGVESILANPALPPALPIIRLEDAGMGAQMIDYCLYDVLRWMCRRDEYAAQQKVGIWREQPVEERADWPIGLFGLGALGRQVATAFAALGFPVNAYARSVHNGDDRITYFASSGGAGDLAAFMQATRVLIILAPLTAATQDRFDLSGLALLPRSSYVINVARGGLLVDEALLELLDSGHLAGAALDVFREEPLPPEHPFWAHPKIRITPHTAAATLIAPSALQIAGKIRRLQHNEPISGIVGRERGY